MRIRSVRLDRVVIPFLEPFRIANGEVSKKEAIIVSIQTTDGVRGVGEASPMGGSFYSDETPDSTWKFLNEVLIPHVFTLPDYSPEQFAEYLNQFTHEPFARAGLEGAVWEAYAHQIGSPLYALLGGKRTDIPSGAAIGLFDTIDELLSRVEKFLHFGYRRIKIKIQPGWDIEPLRAIRNRFGNIPLMVDANASYGIDRDVSIFNEIDQFGLMMIEQPLAKESFEESAELQRRLQTPLCADESAYSFEALEKIIELRSAKIINIKVQRVGGLYNAKRMAERAMRAGMPCWLGTMPELGIASAQGLHLASHPAFQYPTDIEASDRWYREDIISPNIEVEPSGVIVLRNWGADAAKISRFSIEEKVFSA